MLAATANKDVIGGKIGEIAEIAIWIINTEATHCHLVFTSSKLALIESITPSFLSTNIYALKLKKNAAINPGIINKINPTPIIKADNSVRPIYGSTTGLLFSKASLNSILLPLALSSWVIVRAGKNMQPITNKISRTITDIKILIKPPFVRIGKITNGIAKAASPTGTNASIIKVNKFSLSASRLSL